MNKSLLYNLSGLSELEKKGDWNEIVILMQKYENEASNNVSLFLRISTEYWFILINDECNQSLDNNYLKSKLISLFYRGTKIYSNNFHFLWVFGYMIFLFPDVFSEKSDDYFKWKDIGEKMIIKAHSLAPYDLVIDLIYNRIFNDLSPNEECIVQINEYFSFDTLIDKYFKDVLIS